MANNLTNSTCAVFARCPLMSPPMYCTTARWKDSRGTLRSCWEAVHSTILYEGPANDLFTSDGMPTEHCYLCLTDKRLLGDVGCPHWDSSFKAENFRH
jgi:hypothetical protein